MAYTPLNWQSGDIVTAEKLNQMKGGVVIITPVEEGGVTSLGYSYQDIVAMLENNIMPVVWSEVEAGFFSVQQPLEMGNEEGTYFVGFNGTVFSANTEAGDLIKEE